MEDIEYTIKFIKIIKPNIVCMVDNCYGEFIETIEPTEFGADIMAGSLMKNIGGGIAPKILEKLKEGVFMQAFTNKGRLSILVSQMPVMVVLNDKIPLLGCGNYLNIHSDEEKSLSKVS